MPNRFTPIQPNTESSQQLAIINKNFGELDNENVKKLYSGSDGVPRIYIDGTTGVIKVAPEGIDVTTATDDQLNFNSDQNVLKVVQTGTISLGAISVTAPGAGNYAESTLTAEVNHNLGYSPVLLSFVYDGTIYIPAPYYDLFGGGTRAWWLNLKVAVDATKVYATLQVVLTGATNFTNSGPWNIKYYLLQETAN